MLFSIQEGKRLLKLSKRKDYYKILDVDRNATDLEIKKAYRKKAMAHHPGMRCSTVLGLKFVSAIPKKVLVNKMMYVSPRRK